MPQPLAGACVQRHQAVAKQVLPVAIGAVKVEARSAERNVSNPALLVYGHFIPVVHSAAGFPKVLWPRFVTELARMRNRMKDPHELSASSVVGVDIGRDRGIVIAPRGQRNNEQVLENAPRIIR